MTAAHGVLPEPLVPAGVDLSGMAFMPLDVSRVLDSDLFALSTGEEFKAAVALWCKSWMQVPAGSLPNNDRVLAHLSGANGRWAKLKEQALHGWQLCSDGRLYHAVIAEKALTAWGERLSYLEKLAADTERKRVHREESKELRGQLAVHGVHVAWNESVAVMRTMIQQLPQNSHKDSDIPVTRTGASPATDLSPAIKREVKVKVKVKDLNQEHVPQHGVPDDEHESGTPPSEQGEAQSPVTHGSVQPALAMSQPSRAQVKPDPLAGFAEFYAAYPKRQKRAEAEKAWRKLNPSPELQATILAALAVHKAQDAWQRDAGQFVPLPASWLNAERWLDELDVSTLTSACPAADIVGIYHEFCPNFATVTVLDDTLREMIQERWAEHPVQQDLGFWQDFFHAANQLTHVFYRGDQRKPYLEALVARPNFRDIVEGRRHA